MLNVKNLKYLQRLKCKTHAKMKLQSTRRKANKSPEQELNEKQFRDKIKDTQVIDRHLKYEEKMQLHN